MKKCVLSIVCVLAFCLTSAFFSLNAYAYANEKSDDRKICIVIGENDTYVLLNNNCQLEKGILGNGHVLEYGDIVEIKNATILLTAPGQFAFNSNTSVKYIGTVSEVYKDNIKKLTVTNIPFDTPIELTDSEGNTYTWSSIAGFDYEKLMGKKGFEYRITPANLNVGDVLSCAVEENVESSMRKVVLPIGILSKTATNIVGDANSDNFVNVRDSAFIANALASGNAESLPNTADYNKDGKKNVRDAAAISKDLASK